MHYWDSVDSVVPVHRRHDLVSQVLSRFEKDKTDILRVVPSERLVPVIRQRASKPAELA